MGGEIGVESVKGVGSTFWFTAQFTAVDVRSRGAQHNPEVSQLLQNKQLLLLESDTRLSQYLMQYCNAWGLTLHTAGSIDAALVELDQLRQSGVSLDFIAVNFHSINADLAAIKRLRNEGKTQHVPLFLLGNYDVPADDPRWAELNIHTILRKPVSLRTFKLELAAILGVDVPAPSPQKQSLQNYRLFSHLRVLVAEDNAVNRMVIKGLLGKLHIEPELVENGAEAFDAVRNTETPFDLILMDCEMPEMDGFEATRSIREYERTQNLSATPIVALTAHALQEHRDAVFAAGMNHYLSKPITLDSLYATFEKTGLMKANSPR